MSSKRAIRRKQCTGKVRHDTQEHALVAVRALVKKYAGNIGHLSPYRCGFCGGWHVGHTPGRQRRFL